MRNLIIAKVFLVIFLLTFSFTNSNASDVSGYRVGDVVENFAISNWDGNTYSLNETNSKATVIMFWSTTCPFVQPYTERINNLATEFSAQGVTFWGINSNKTEPVDEVIAHSKEHAYTFAMLKDEGNVIADQFGAERTPEVFVIDNETMTVVYHGTIDNDKEASKVTSNDLRNALEQMLAGKEIEVKETKAFGCTIKR